MLRSHRLLLPAAFITSLGNNIQLIGAALLLVQARGSMLDVGWLFIAVAVPQAVLSPYFGRIADRFDRRRLWVGCDVVSAAAALCLPIGLAVGVPQQTLVYASNFALAVVAALFVPASAALVRERVPAPELRRFNAHYEIALQCGMLLSASVGGFALQYFGSTPLFVFNAITFVASGLLVLAVGRGARRTTAAVEELRPATTPSRRRLPLGALALLYGQGLVVVTVFNALLPVLVVGEWRRGPAVVGVVDALGGAGFLLAAMVYRRTGVRFGDLRVALFGFVACNALLVVQPLFGVSVLMGLVLVGAFVFGQARIATRSLLMTSVEESRVGRAFGVANGYGLAATVVVMLIASVVTGRTDTRYGFATLVAISLAAAVLAAVWIRRSTFPRRPASHDHEAGTVVRSSGRAVRPAGGVD
ncbi:putative MFS family arabinose efflux permease [Kribbella steppae]|uniref:Putative MFS family arabinose efflux permease n=1 Tax=Kribbella steppae TaxID=2512223 RepID=A0A4R2HD14_9ACTN|nr:MFS transporter [Kribbella steppae]TCO26262.1 putative MFS family arabinose efflux permease [Kribbella steppae]